MNESIQELINKIEKGVPVFTVNIRLARYIRMKFDSAMVDKGLKAWQTPDIIPFSTWLLRVWGEKWHDVPSVSKPAARMLWEKIISEDISNSGNKSSPHNIARKAIEAHHIMKSYNILPAENTAYLTEETISFKRWVRLYQKRLDKLGYMDGELLPDKVSDFILSGEAPLPEHLIIAGFDEVTPQFKNILDLIRTRGSTIEYWPEKPVENIQQVNIPPNVKINLHSCENMVEEVKYLSRWIRKTYRTGMTIGVIAPDIRIYRNMILKEFASELAPLTALSGDGSNEVFNISMGDSLYNEAIVHSALDILNITGRRMNIDEISRILLSPYLFYSKEEFLQRARLDSDLKRTNSFEMTLSELRYRISTHDFNAPLSDRALGEWINFLKEDSGKKLPSQWAGRFTDLLKSLQWPTACDSLSNREYQSLAAWKEALSALSSLDDFSGPIKRADAVKHLSTISREQIFQPESLDSGIQVMGLLESTGIEFDHIWLLGMHEYAIPKKPSPNPFIPIDKQKAANLPHSSFERELNFSSLIMKRILKMSKSADASYPAVVDEMELSPSPLIMNASTNIVDPYIAESSRLKDIIHKEAIALEEMLEPNEIPLTEGEAKDIRGGTSILRDQSACPFRAFAVHRLKSAGIEEPEPGINPMERGSLLHKVLEHLFTNIRDSKKLLSLLESGNIDKIIKKSIDAVIDAEKIKNLSESEFMSIEKERIHKLLMEWLNIEALRRNFHLVKAEEKCSLNLGPLEIKGRIDRIDEMEYGGQVIIDYKTGSAHTNDWLSKRPKEPQMMLYSMINSLDAITFASLKSGNCRFVGIAREDESLPGIKAFGTDNFSKKLEGCDDWDGLMEQWRTVVTGLAESFCKGEVQVDPRGYESQDSACTYCDQSILCRIYDEEKL